jgi:hypothetical protein
MLSGLDTKRKSVEDILAGVEWMGKNCNKYKDDNFSKCSKVWTHAGEMFIKEVLQRAEG